MKLTPNQKAMGVRIDGMDLSQALNPAQFATILSALGRYGVICFPKQTLDARALKAFSERFGTLQGSPTGTYREPDVPEVMLLSNIVENGTAFADMHAAYEDLAPALKRKLATATATHDFNKFWEEMRKRPGSTRPALTPEQRAVRAPSVHPLFLTHPITGRKVLYANPCYAVRINELDEAESDTILAELTRHQLLPKYQYAHQWTKGDVLMWDHIGTLHNAIPDYGPHEYRLIKRCQVMADRIFDPAFVHEHLAQAAV